MGAALGGSDLPIMAPLIRTELSLTLRQLERDGLVTRTVHAEVSVEYELTELAHTLIPHAVALANWAVENNPAIDAHRATYDENKI